MWERWLAKLCVAAQQGTQACQYTLGLVNERDNETYENISIENRETMKQEYVNVTRTGKLRTAPVAFFHGSGGLVGSK